jgi:G patch domain-containing protein 1
LDPRSRAALLGEQALPGKSVFDFLSGSSRAQLAAGSGRQNLPPAKGEVPAGYELSEEDRNAAFLERIPTLDRQTAIAALARGSGGPYANDEVKRSRYRGYLEHFANPARSLPEKPEGIRDDDYIKEMTEFANCAKIFKPMTGFMASRFTTGKKTTVIPGSDGATGDSELISEPEPKVADPAEEAAKMGMFGKMTRSTVEFYPTRLLCKRFNVRPPAHSQGDDAGGKANEAGREEAPRPAEQAQVQLPVREETKLLAARQTEEKPAEVVDPEQNKAVEGTAAHAEVLRAIFGDSDSE